MSDAGSPRVLLEKSRARLTPDQQHALKVATDRLTEEFTGVFGHETIELFLNTSYDEFASRASVTIYLALLAERFARQRLRALARVQGRAGTDTPIVLFLCTHNAGRSQMALGWFNHLAGGAAVAWSGGSEPVTDLNPAAVGAMAEAGIDITEEYSKPWTEGIVQAADVVITMGCGDACPIFPAKQYLDWDLPDPAGKPLEEVRPIRDEIRRRVEALLDDLPRLGLAGLAPGLVPEDQGSGTRAGAIGNG